jgi:hypothetical protein
VIETSGTRHRHAGGCAANIVGTVPLRSCGGFGGSPSGDGGGLVNCFDVVDFFGADVHEQVFAFRIVTAPALTRGNGRLVRDILDDSV